MKIAFHWVIFIMAMFGLNHMAEVNGYAALFYAGLILITALGAIAAAVRKHNQEVDNYYD